MSACELDATPAGTARELAALSEENQRTVHPVAEPITPAALAPVIAAELGSRAESRLAQVHARDKAFSGMSWLFGDPGWLILLEIAAAEGRKRPCTTSSIGIGVVPPTTVHRYLTAFCEQGVLQRVPDPTDGRRSFLRLTPAAVMMLSQALAV